MLTLKKPQIDQYTVDKFEEFLKLSQNRDRLFELIHGRIVEKMPTEEHGAITLNIGAALHAFVNQHKLGRVAVEVRHQLKKDKLNARVPDISFISGSRPAVREGGVPLMPDLTVEIKSPDDTLKAMREKAEYYLANGVRLVWLIFPHKRFIEVYSPDAETEILFGSDVLTGGDVLPGFTIPVEQAFAGL